MKINLLIPTFLILVSANLLPAASQLVRFQGADRLVVADIIGEGDRLVQLRIKSGSDSWDIAVPSERLELLGELDPADSQIALIAAERAIDLGLYDEAFDQLQLYSDMMQDSTLSDERAVNLIELLLSSALTYLDEREEEAGDFEKTLIDEDRTALLTRAFSVGYEFKPADEVLKSKLATLKKRLASSTHNETSMRMISIIDPKNIAVPQFARTLARQYRIGEAKLLMQRYVQERPNDVAGLSHLLELTAASDQFSEGIDLLESSPINWKKAERSTSLFLRELMTHRPWPRNIDRRPEDIYELLVSKGAFVERLILLQCLAAYEPGNGQVHYEIAEILESQRDLEGALDAFESAAQCSNAPGDASRRYEVMTFLFDLFRSEAAARASMEWAYTKITRVEYVIIPLTIFYTDGSSETIFITDTIYITETRNERLGDFIRNTIARRPKIPYSSKISDEQIAELKEYKEMLDNRDIMYRGANYI